MTTENGIVCTGPVLRCDLGACETTDGSIACLTACPTSAPRADAPAETTRSLTDEHFLTDPRFANPWK